MAIVEIPVTISGSVVTAEDASARDFINLVTDITPVQDLHGYSHPWAGGVGTNILPPITKGTYEGGGITVTVGDNNFITVSGTKNTSSAVTIQLAYDVITQHNIYGYYIHDRNSIGNSSMRIYLGTNANNEFVYSGLSSVNRIQQANLDFVMDYCAMYFSSGIASGTALSFTLQPSVEPTNETTDWTPYSNICPITGHTETNVYRTDVDIYDSDGTIAINNKSTVTINSKNSITVASNSAGTYISSKQLLSSYNLETGKTYRLSAKVTGITGNGNPRITIRNSSNAIQIYSIPLLNEEGSFVFTYDPSVYNYISFFATFSTSTTGSVTYSDINFRECIDTEIDLSSAGTVYGGNYDVLTGELTVTDANIASYNGETLPSTWISSMDAYTSGGTPTTGAQVVYKLETPLTYQLTGTTMTATVGTNVVWADTGDVTLTYYRSVDMALSTMYPSKNGSPKTTLASGITASATEMTLDDTSVLPPAPNLAVLGEDANAEIVLYNGIAGNAVTGMVRGINGTTASSWPEDTVVARNFTSYDHDTIIGNITDLDTYKAPLESPALTGTPTTPTASLATDTTQIASTAFVQLHAPIHLSVTASAGNAITKSDARITSTMRVINIALGTPSNVTTDITWTTSTGSVTFNATFTGSTTIDFDLVETN